MYLQGACKVLADACKVVIFEDFAVQFIYSENATTTSNCKV